MHGVERLEVVIPVVWRGRHDKLDVLQARRGQGTELLTMEM